MPRNSLPLHFLLAALLCGCGAKPPPAAMGGTAAPALTREVQVVTVAAATEPVARDLTAIGTAYANESIDVTSKVSNTVTAVRFSDGQRVKRGDVLIELDSAQLRADLAAAQAELVESDSQYRRGRELLPTQAVSKSQFDQLEAAKTAAAARVAAAQARLQDTVIRAPFAGRVGLRRISIGSLISPGTVITTLDDSSTMKLDFRVPENDLAGLAVGMPVSAATAAYPQRSFAGTIESIDSRIDPVSRTITARARIENKDAALKTGMFMTVALRTRERSAVVIPEEALTPEEATQHVFVVVDDVASRREVRIGLRLPGKVEIIAGLAAGERVVTEGLQNLRDGVKIRELAATDAGSGA
ncbi:MAG: efflux RND transporter periplasmic adaptor subunit [Steroidobacteraceae bacterium]